VSAPGRVQTTRTDSLRSTEDWSITSGATTVDAVNKDLQGWFAGPKTPGLIILEV
jgi:chitin deacetylase